jgi:hypothetical protein
MILVAGCCGVLSSFGLISLQTGKTAENVFGSIAYAASPELLESDCNTKNKCEDYSIYWKDSCPLGERCIEFKNSCTKDITLSYQIGCNADGTRGAPQCDCTEGPTIKSGKFKYWQIVNGNYDPTCPAYWEPACLTGGLAVMANAGSGADCSQGTRVELAAGNSGNIYGKFDSYNISTQGDAGGGWYSVPVVFKPSPAVADPYDSTKLNCRTLYCNSLECPDAYLTPTTGGCFDNRSPQGNCAPTFSKSSGYLVEFCPSNCTTTSCPSCQKDSASTNLAAGDLDGGSAASDGKTSSSADVMARNDLVGVTSEGHIYYALQALSADWQNLPGRLAQIAAADIDGDFVEEIFGITDGGEIYYTNDLLPGWQWMPGVLSQLAVCDLNGDDIADLVGIGPDGSIYYTLDRLNWKWMPGMLSQLTCADINGDGLGDVAGVTSTKDIFYSLDNENWQHLPGKLTQLASGHIDGDSKADLVGLTSSGNVYYTLDLSHWIYMPGILSQIAVGDLDSDLRGDLVGLSPTGEVFYTLDLITWNQLPGNFRCP